MYAYPPSSDWHKTQSSMGVQPMFPDWHKKNSQEKSNLRVTPKGHPLV